MRKWIALVGAMLAGAGCDRPMIEWGQPTSSSADTLGGLGIASDGSVTFAPAAAIARVPPDSLRCDSSVVYARDGGQSYAAWYRRRPDASVLVVAARSSDDGVTWSTPGVADSVDVARVGCSRPGPSIAASGGYVHVAYSLEAPEGYGVFFAHSMDGTATFHAALPVIYGDRLSGEAVAADGMNVVVAYEDPSGTGRRVDVALSRTQGHTFEPRVRASPDEMTAVRPEVALRGDVLGVSFAEPMGSGRILIIGHVH